MICILDEFGKVFRKRVVHGSLRQLAAAMKALKKELGGTIKVCYEATCGCGWRHDQLTAIGLKVQCGSSGQVAYDLSFQA
jgi:hypothetical protein